MLVKLKSALMTEYPNANLSWSGNGSLFGFWTTSNGTNANVAISDTTVADATSSFNSLSTPQSGVDVSSPTQVTLWGQQAATSALGHAPTTVNDAYLKGTGDSAGVDSEYIQYDSIFMGITYAPAAS